MRSYRTKEEVPWKDILAILRWYLNRKACFIQMNLGRGRPDCAKLDLPGLETGYNSLYHLRRFLGYREETKCEREARRILEKQSF